MRLLFLALSFAWFSYVGHATMSRGAEPTINFEPLPADQVLVPQYLLNLVHTREVQDEMELSGEQTTRLEELLREIDQVWWKSRILPIAQQRKIIAEKEAKLLVGLRKIANAQAVYRLRQIELQAQSVRMLVRPDVIKFLKIESSQGKKLAELFAATDRLSAEASAAKEKADEGKQKALLDAKSAELSKALEILTPAQAERIRQSLGKPLDTAKFERIYPLAPELIDSGHWIDDSRVSLQSLRGQVVLVHFYAFQCHNCVANFEHYRRWERELSSKGVKVIGIQTPETPAERQVEQVVAAAKKAEFQFPVLIDLENKNWDVWGNTMWPTVYVIDKKGYVRFWWQGELNWQGATGDKKIELLVEQLLNET